MWLPDQRDSAVFFPGARAAAGQPELEPLSRLAAGGGGGGGVSLRREDGGAGQGEGQRRGDLEL